MQPLMAKDYYLNLDHPRNFGACPGSDSSHDGVLVYQNICPWQVLLRQFLDSTIQNTSPLPTLSPVLNDLSFGTTKVHRCYTNLKSEFTN